MRQQVDQAAELTAAQGVHIEEYERDAFVPVVRPASILRCFGNFTLTQYFTLGSEVRKSESASDQQHQSGNVALGSESGCHVRCGERKRCARSGRSEGLMQVRSGLHGRQSEPLRLCGIRR